MPICAAMGQGDEVTAGVPRETYRGGDRALAFRAVAEGFVARANPIGGAHNDGIPRSLGSTDVGRRRSVRLIPSFRD